jgi:hypothetical protein
LLSFLAARRLRPASCTVYEQDPAVSTMPSERLHSFAGRPLIHTGRGVVIACVSGQNDAAALGWVCTAPLSSGRCSACDARRMRSPTRP